MVEISSLTEHLLTECDKRDGFGKCPRCSEAIPKEELPGHIKTKECNRECTQSSRRAWSDMGIVGGDAPFLPCRELTQVTRSFLLKLFQLPNRRRWQTAVPCVMRTLLLEKR